MPAWLYIAIGSSIALASFAAAIIFLFGDRSRSRRRCPSCWYDLAAIPGVRCPECGRSVRSERALFRTRRRKLRAAIAATLMFCGCAAALWPVLRRQSLWPHLPSSLLIEIWDRAPNDRRGWRWKAERELHNRTLSPAQYNSLIRAGCRALRDTSPGGGPGLVWYNLESFSRAGDIVHVGEYRPRESNDPLEPTDQPYPLLTSGVASELVDSLASWWQSDAEQGVTPMLAIRQLACGNPAAASYCTEQVFTQRAPWPLHTIDPRCNGGEVMKKLLQEYRGQDSQRRARAAAALAEFFFDATVFARSRDTGLAAEIRAEYPDYNELVCAAEPAGEDLLQIALSSDPDAEVAARALTHIALTCPKQAMALKDQANRFSPAAKAEIERITRLMDAGAK